MGALMHWLWNAWDGSWIPPAPFRSSFRYMVAHIDMDLTSIM